MKPFPFLTNSILLVISAVYPITSFAEETSELSEIHIIGHKPSQSGASLDSGSKRTISESELQAVRAVSLGQTVEKISGVHNNSFSEAAVL